MKLIGVVGRVYYNKDEQEIIQVNDAIRKTLAKYSNIVTILLLPINHYNYHGLKMGSDKIDDIGKGKLDYILDKCDGFVVPGGTNWYKIDEYVINYAIRAGKPLLGICAGFQAICSMFAINREKFDMTKKLDNDIHYRKPWQYVHNNIVLENTLLMRILGKEKIMVNSLHHDYIDFKMRNLVISAVSEDGITEAVELPGHSFFLGIQWHPEYLMDANSIKIFDRFIDSLKELQ